MAKIKGWTKIRKNFYESDLTKKRIYVAKTKPHQTPKPKFFVMYGINILTKYMTKLNAEKYMMNFMRKYPKG
ncbi:MAG: hypothetical protein KAS32_18565 [Candidatus Peribacteraceae bacterium]|nr:hypothetical protein [Candidatus Peribacteraceae bacterium]